MPKNHDLPHCSDIVVGILSVTVFFCVSILNQCMYIMQYGSNLVCILLILKLLL